MPCYQPKPAWQAKLGAPLSFTFIRGYRTVMVPCSTCIGCIKAHAQAWAFRCHLEGQRLPYNAFATLTYDNAHLPFTLNWAHGQKFLNSLRQMLATRNLPKIRYFASGEYGSRTQRPHYHLILFGLNALGAANHTMVQNAWGRGQIRLEPLTPARIAYCAGYTDKKSDDRFRSVAHADPQTGEAWQPPFIKMSRNPGLGSHAKQYAESWRLFAIHNGIKMPPPRYLHNAWRNTATTEDLLHLQAEKERYALNRDTTDLNGQLRAGETIAKKKQQRSSEQRHI